MKSMHPYILDWDLHDADIMPETRTSKLCKVIRGETGQPAVLKYLKEEGRADEAMGAHLLEYYGGQGAVNIYRYDDQAQLLEYADSHDLLYAMNHHSVSDEAATQIIADVVRELHAPRSTPVPDGLVPLRERFSELYQRASSNRHSGLTTVFTRAATLADHLLATQVQQIPLHGDLHHENIVKSSQRGWLAIDPKGLIGDPAYDVANIFCNPDMPDTIPLDQGRMIRLADHFAGTLNLSAPRILQFAAVHAALSASWSLSENHQADAARRLNAASILLDREPALAA